MEKTYYIDTYKKECECTVLSVTEKENCLEVITDRTVFYPECGGQPGDRGFIGTCRVIDTLKADNGDSIHIVEKGSAIKPGQTFTMKLDWPFRYRYMILHTCQHMLSGLLFNKFNIGTLSVHLGEEYLTIEINQSEISEETVNSLIECANIEIAKCHKIFYHLMSLEEAQALGLRRSIKVDSDVRIVEIEDVDKIACGGVHVSDTSQIRLVVCTGNEIIRGHVRLFFKCADDAIKYSLENIKAVKTLVANTGCSNADEAVRKVEKLTETCATQKLKLQKYESILAKFEIKENIKDNIACFDTELDLQGFVKAVNEMNEIALCVFSNSHWLIVLKGKYQSLDFNIIKEQVLNTFKAKGGGRNGIYQGLCDKSFVKDFFQLCKRIF